MKKPENNSKNSAPDLINAYVDKETGDVIDKETGEIIELKTAESELPSLFGNERQNVNFVQWDRRAMKDFRLLLSTDVHAVKILTWMAEHMGRTNALVCSYATLMEITGKSRPTVARSMKKLKEGNWVQPVRIGSAVAWVINSAVFWTASANGKQYSKFHATVIASASEQDKAELERTVKLNHMPMYQGERVIPGANDLEPPDQADLDLN